MPHNNRIYPPNSNLTRRRVEHALLWTPYSKRFGFSKLVYVECFETRSEAMKREKYFKTGKGREFLAQYLSNQS